MERTKLLDEPWILEAADALGDLLDDMASVFRKSMPIIERLDALGDEEFVASLLKIRSGIGHHDVAAFRALARILKEIPESDDKAKLSPATALALQGASESIRGGAWDVLRSGGSLNPELVSRLESLARFTSKTESGRTEESRSRLLESMIARASPNVVRMIESSIDELLDTVDQFRWDHFPRDLSEEFEPSVTRKEYLADYANVVSLAQVALNRFERHVGSVESIPEGRPGSHEEALKRAGIALERFASGGFGDRCGFAFQVYPPAMLSTEMTDALFYLASNPFSVSEVVGPTTKPLKRLRALELCAGAGGQAIGLMSAGFRHVALYEKSHKRTRTLRKNWPTWKVRRADVRDVTDDELLGYRGIDLLAGGPPCEPFSQAGTRLGRHHDKNLFPEMIRAVRIVRPRAFMFENVPGLAYGAHAAYLASICAELAELNYKVEVFMLNAEDFGLPQERRRLLIVGIHGDVEGTFVPPALRRPLRRSVVEVLGPLVIRHETPVHLRHLVPPGSNQERYDQWAESWRAAHAKHRLPTITKTSSEDRAPRLARWAEIGFDVSSFADEPPMVSEVTGPDFKPRLTLGMLARSQGFPSRWGFYAEGGGNVDMIGDAFPAVMAKAVGLAVYTALTGVRFDLDAALTEPLIDEKMIGLRPLRSRKGRSWQETEGAEKAHRILAGRPEAEVEPNPKRRRMLRDVVHSMDASERGLDLPVVLSETAFYKSHFRKMRPA